MINFFKIPNQPPLVFKNGINVVENTEILQQLVNFLRLLDDSANLEKSSYLKVPISGGSSYGFGWSTYKYRKIRYFISDNSEQLEINNDIVARKEKGRLIELNFNFDISEKSENALIYTDEIDQKLFIPRALPWIFDFSDIDFEVGHLSSYSETDLCSGQIDRIEAFIENICLRKAESDAKQYLRSLFEKLTRISEVSTIIESDYFLCPTSLEIKYRNLKRILGDPGYGILPNFQIITCNPEWKYSMC